MSSKFHYKNVDIAKKYGVSNPTIGEWIEASLQGKNDLKLYKVKQKHKILISPGNEIELARLAKNAKKYSSSNFNLKTKPQKSFYNFFNQEEVLEIINDLKFKNQIKHKYVYKDPIHWDKFYKKGRPESTFSELDLINQTIDDLNYYLNDTKNINLIEIGPGNGLPAIELLKKINRVGSFVGIDLSDDMNSLAEKNISKFYSKLKTSFYKRDIENGTLSQILFKSKSEPNSSNLIVSIGSTISNIDDRISVYKNIRRSMDGDDIFILSFSMNNQNSREALSYIKDEDGLARDGWHLQLMGIDIDKCGVEIFFNDKENYKDKVYEMDKTYEITFDIYDQQKTVIIDKGTKISTWRHYLQTTTEVINDLEKSDFEVLAVKKDNMKKYGLAVCKIKSD